MIYKDMHIVEKNLFNIKERIERTCVEFDRDPTKVKLIVITKKFNKEALKPILDSGHLLFGENKVQEAYAKWSDLLKQYKDLEIHMVGGLQSNKINEATSFFTCIHSVDRHKILEGINKNITEDSSLKDVFIQVNISNEASKGGIEVSDVDDFLDGAKKYGNINILGLMTMPPPNEEPSVYFALLNKLAKKNNLKCLSMGMSNDFETAIALGATHIRVGEAIMGPRVKV
ncbi:YggS family pyridoxal phosphate-dependent enzyme [Hyphomicrobiales bacterium]|nr:YggS family pyridoxal phosphate-dependent enzyme [Hyphomicrobiales bacterium]